MLFYGYTNTKTQFFYSPINDIIFPKYSGGDPHALGTPYVLNPVRSTFGTYTPMSGVYMSVIRRTLQQI